METIKTWQERCLERGIGSCEARDEELTELRVETQTLMAHIRAFTDDHAKVENALIMCNECHDRFNLEEATHHLSLSTE